MNKSEQFTEPPFESIKHYDELGNEFWYARELQKVLEYSKWSNFEKVIKKAMISCDNVGIPTSDCFADVRKPIITGKGKQELQIEFQNKGYQGLYGGLGQKDIHERKGLKKSQRILDHMGSEELAANLFRATQTDAKLRRDKIQGKDAANETHFTVGAKVRDTTKELGGTMPEDLPTPEKSIKVLRKEEQKRSEFTTLKSVK